MIRTFTAAALAAAAVASPAMAQSPRADQLAFRDLYKELIEINTTLSVGSCTAASEAMATRLKAAGFADAAHMSRTFRRMFGVAPTEVVGLVRWVLPPA